MFFFGYLLFILLGGVLFLRPAWFGFRILVGGLNPLQEAWEALVSDADCVFEEVKGLGQAKVQSVGKGILRAILDFATGKPDEVVADVSALAQHGWEVYTNWTRTWEARVRAVPHLPPADAMRTIDQFWVWLQSPKVAEVLGALGRRAGLGWDAVAQHQARLQALATAHGPHLARGLWYGLYATLVFQLLVLEALYLWGSPVALLWGARILLALNLIRGIHLLWKLRRIWPVRSELRAIAAALGIPNLIGHSLRLLAGQALGCVVIALFVLRTFALGEALHRPGGVLASIHAGCMGIWEVYLLAGRWVVEHWWV